MCAIISGLYAAGYSANQIEDIVVNTDFMTFLRDKISRSSETFFEKGYGEKTVITLPVNNGKTIIDNSEYLNAFGYIKLDTYDQNILQLKEIL